MNEPTELTAEQLATLAEETGGLLLGGDSDPLGDLDTTNGLGGEFHFCAGSESISDGRGFARSDGTGGGAFGRTP